jgi:hypothetical protein
MSDDARAVDYSGTSDSDSESDKVPSTEEPSESQLRVERNRAFWRRGMISASFRGSCRFRMRTFIAGIDVDRRLRRDLLRPLHMWCQLLLKQ